MRELLAAALLGMLALPARADVVDAGNLSIGGTGVFGGSVTVQGSDAQGYSLKAASGAYLGGCVRFGDSTQQCSAATGSVPNIAFASGTVNQATTSAAWTSLVGSTISLTVGSNSRVKVIFSGANTDSGTAAMNTLIDGALLCPVGSPDYGCSTGRDRNGDSYMTNFILLTPVLSSGAHYFSMVQRAADGTGTSTTLGSPPWSIIVEEVEQ